MSSSLVDRNLWKTSFIPSGSPYYSIRNILLCLFILFLFRLCTNSSYSTRLIMWLKYVIFRFFWYLILLWFAPCVLPVIFGMQSVHDIFRIHLKTHNTSRFFPTGWNYSFEKLFMIFLSHFYVVIFILRRENAFSVSVILIYNRSLLEILMFLLYAGFFWYIVICFLLDREILSLSPFFWFHFRIFCICKKYSYIYIYI